MVTLPLTNGLGPTTPGANGRRGKAKTAQAFASHPAVIAAGPTKARNLGGNYRLLWWRMPQTQHCPQDAPIGRPILTKLVPVLENIIAALTVNTGHSLASSGKSFIAPGHALHVLVKLAFHMHVP